MMVFQKTGFDGQIGLNRLTPRKLLWVCVLRATPRSYRQDFTPGQHRWQALPQKPLSRTSTAAANAHPLMSHDLR